MPWESRSARACRPLRGLSRAGSRLLAIGWGGFGIAPDLLDAGLLSVIGGIGNGIVTVRFRTMVQRETPPHERASTFGFAYAVTFSMIVVGQVAVVPLSNVLGQRATFTMRERSSRRRADRGALTWPRARPLRTGAREASERSPVHAR